MSEEIPSIISHVSVGTNNFARAIKFYDAVLATLGCRVIMEHDDARAYGKQYPEFWVQSPINGKPASVGEGTHFGLVAASQRQVKDFHEAAIANGATDDGAPGPRSEYGEPYFGCFVRDLDGHKIEATFWDIALAQKLGMMD